MKMEKKREKITNIVDTQAVMNYIMRVFAVQGGFGLDSVITK